MLCYFAAFRHVFAAWVGNSIPLKVRKLTKEPRDYPCNNVILLTSNVYIPVVVCFAIALWRDILYNEPRRQMAMKMKNYQFYFADFQHVFVKCSIYWTVPLISWAVCWYQSPRTFFLKLLRSTFCLHKEKTNPVQTKKSYGGVFYGFF